MRDHRCLVHLRAAREHCRDSCNADAAACVAHQVEYTRRISHLFIAECSERHRGQRHEYKSHREAANDIGPDDAADRNLQIDLAEQIDRISEHAKAEHHEITASHSID